MKRIGTSYARSSGRVTARRSKSRSSRAKPRRDQDSEHDAAYTAREIIGTQVDGGVANAYREKADFRSGCAPCKGGAFQWVRGPPGNRSSRKQPEQSWRRRNG
jgi:hypothetical protein